MAKSFSAKFNKSGKNLYNIALEAIINIGYNIESEDNKKLIIFAKTSMSWKTFGQDLEIAIKGSNIKLQTRSGQLTDYGEGKEISEKLFDEIKKLSKSAKKIKPVRKEKIEQSIQKTKKSSQSKLIWWILGIVGFIILLIMMSSGGNKSGSGVVCYFEGQVDNKPFKFKRECVYTCFVGDRKERVLRYEDMPNNCPSFPKHLY